MTNLTDKTAMEELQRRLRIGANTIPHANDLLAESYATIGAANAEIGRLRAALFEIAQPASTYATTPPSVVIARRALNCKMIDDD